MSEILFIAYLVEGFTLVCIAFGATVILTEMLEGWT